MVSVLNVMLNCVNKFSLPTFFFFFVEVHVRIAVYGAIKIFESRCCLLLETIHANSHRNIGASATYPQFLTPYFHIALFHYVIEVRSHGNRFKSVFSFFRLLLLKSALHSETTDNLPPVSAFGQPARAGRSIRGWGDAIRQLM